MVHLLACADVRPSRQLLPSCQRPERSCCACAGVNQWLVAVGGRTAEIGWFRTRTDTFHNDVALVDCTQPALQWRAPPVEGSHPLRGSSTPCLRSPPAACCSLEVGPALTCRWVLGMRHARRWCFLVMSHLCQACAQISPDSLSEG